ncbi:MAG TPA: hypothetical protein EYP53_01720 [Candidatus Latescibacteria bacterium]|nr:hypothetical protein [Candidatus Latescibacterota bacterium]
MDFSVGNISLLARPAMKGVGPEAIRRKVADMHKEEPQLRINLPPVPEEGTWTAKFAVPVSWSSDEIIRL